MNEPDVRRIRAGALRLLLYARGFRRVYGFLGGEAPGRPEQTRWLAELVRQGVLEPEQGSLRLREPWRAWVACLGGARRAVRLDGPALPSAVCAYPLGGGALLCSPLARSPQIIRFCTADADTLWQRLQTLTPLPPQDAIPADANRLCGAQAARELFSMRAVALPQAAVADERVIVQMPLCKAELAGTNARPYDTGALAALLMEWLEESV